MTRVEPFALFVLAMLALLAGCAAGPDLAPLRREEDGVPDGPHAAHAPPLGFAGPLSVTWTMELRPPSQGPTLFQGVPGSRDVVQGMDGNMGAGVARFGPDGWTRWVTRMTAQEADGSILFVDGLAVDLAGDVYVLISHGGEVKIDAAGSVASLIAIGKRDIAVAKLAGDTGAILWLHSWGSTDALGHGTGMSLRGDRLAIIGIVRGSAQINVGGTLIGSGIDAVTSYNIDPFAVMLSTEGGILFARSFGTELPESADAAAVDDAGGLYMTGSGAVNIDDQTILSEMTFDGFDPAFSSARPGYLIHLNADGAATGAVDLPHHYGLAALDDAAIVVGHALDPVDLGTGTLPFSEDSQPSQNGWLASFDAADSIMWAHGFAGFTAQGLAVDNAGRAVVVGRFSGAMTMGDVYLESAAPRDPLDNFGTFDGYVLRFDALGIPLDGRALGTPYFDACSRIVATPGSGDLVINCGTSASEVDLGPGPLDAPPQSAAHWEFIAGLNGDAGHVADVLTP
jgi:hypothetical protein